MAPIQALDYKSHYRFNRPTIGVLAGWQAFGGTLDSFLDQVFWGIRAAAQDHNCNLLIACGLGSPRETTLGRPAWPVLFPGVDFVPVGPWNTDGLLVAPPLALEVGFPYFNDLSASGFPLVYAGCREVGPAVIVDNESGILQAMAHLVEHGHRRIAFIAGHKYPMLDDSGRRLTAYRAGVKRWNLADDPALIEYSFHTHQGGRNAMTEILRRKVRFSAVIASNDEAAVGAIEALTEAGKQVPQDVAVTGFDDRLEARAHFPQLTSVHHPMFEMGYRSLELLLEILEGKAPRNQLICIPTHLVVRASCGCLPGQEARRFAEPAVYPNSLPPKQVPPTRITSPHQAMPIGPDKNLESVSLKVAEAVSNEGQRMSLVEVRSLCQRLVESFQLSIAQAEPQVFYEMLHQILQRVAEQGDDLHIWQDAITVLRWSASHLVGAVEARLPTAQLENMLHQARLEISESARGQYARLLFERTSLADRVGWMSARFLTAQDMGEVFDLLDDCLPDLGIQKAAVAFFEPQGEDPVAWSQLLLPKECLDKTPRFPSRQFPPLGLCSPTEPFQFILLPLLVQEGLTGFVAFQTHDLSSCADIVRPLAAALRGAHLFQETLQATHQAEEGRRLAEEANRLKSRFLSTVSHELRTPLNLISGISDILRHENSRSKSFDPDLHQKDLERIYLASQHLDSLIRDVLDLARSETGQLSLTLEPIALGEVLSAADAIGEQLARDKELSWHSQFPADLPQVFGDRTRLRQVLLNLITNAVKFTQQGEISLSAWEADGEVIVQVQDTGLGIPLDEQQVIFNEFRQSGRTTRRGYGGLGLGLAICKRLVELHGGRISVYSSGDEGAGSTFSFTLPVKPVSHEAAIQAPGTDLRQVLLLVQDEQSGQRLKEHLESNCIHVCLPELDSDSAWLSQLDQATPDMIIMDSSLASEQGWKILKLLKDNPHTSHIPVISFALGSESGSLLELDYLTKPLGAARLAEVLVSHGFFERGDDKQKTILVVDDEPDILDLQTRLIETQLPGYGVLRACDGREALHILGSTRPALVLLDLMMPELDGFGVLEAMRANPDTCSIPVIVLTSQSLTEADMARLNHGVSYVLGKGVFTVNETLERITNALSRKHKPGSEIQRAVLKAMAFIHTHYSEPISRSMIAAHIGMSERHLTRCFNQEIGVTPITYLNRYRVHQAKVLLDVGEKSITGIALEVGFSSSGYFTRVFRQEIGLSPRDYLRGN